MISCKLNVQLLDCSDLCAHRLIGIIMCALII